MRRLRRGIFGILLMFPVVALGQDRAKLEQQLLGKPLYLRGFWRGQTLEFDTAGQPIGNPEQGPLTLSGVDVRDLTVKGDRVILHAGRVGLIDDGAGRLVRRDLFTTTKLVFMVQKKYTAREELKIVVHADRAGNFESALRVVFADGLADLATSVPPYWSCYAKAFFAEDVDTAYAAQVVEACARRLGSGITLGLGGPSPADITSPHTISGGPLLGGLAQLPQEARELRTSGEVRIHFTIGPHGYVLRPQIIHPLGAGVDEVALQRLSAARLQPALRDGKPVAVDMESTSALHLGK